MKSWKILFREKKEKEIFYCCSTKKNSKEKHKLSSPLKNGCLSPDRCQNVKTQSAYRCCDINIYCTKTTPQPPTTLQRAIWCRFNHLHFNGIAPLTTTIERGANCDFVRGIKNWVCCLRPKIILNWNKTKTCFSKSPNAAQLTFSFLRPIWNANCLAKKKDI